MMLMTWAAAIASMVLLSVLWAMLMMLMMPVTLRLCCCRRPKPKIGKQTDESAEEDPEETPEERGQEGTIGTCHACHGKKYKKDDDIKNLDNRRNLPTGNVHVTKYGECWHASRDYKDLRKSRTVQSKRPCSDCCPA